MAITYEFLHQTPECNHEWTEELSIKAPDPEECPKCKAKGNITRLISGGNGRGLVVLEGQEYIDKVKGDAQKFAKEVYSNESTYANVIGEKNYHNIQSSMDKTRRNKW
jgi:hypothetical protein